jgi:hypothetical protein
MAKNTIYILEDEERLQTFKRNALDRAKEFDIANILPCMSNIMNKSQQRAGSFLKKCS